MKKLFLLSFTMFALFGFWSFQQDQLFYYGFNEKIYLTEVENKLVVKYYETGTRESNQADLSNLISTETTAWQDDRTVIITAVSKSTRDNILKNILNRFQIVSAHPIYKINSGLEMAFTDEFLIKYKESSSSEKRKELENKYNISIIKTTDTYDLLKVPKGVNALEIANKF